jgi:hypothetical protein
MTTLLPLSTDVATPAPRELIDLAIAALPRMQLPSGIYCWERRSGDLQPHGRSLRYTLMTLLGLEKAAAAGHDPGTDLERIHDALWEAIDDPELAPGDYGLHLWLDARTGRGRAGELLPRLERSLAAGGGLPAREGMEMGWIVTGLAEQVAAGNRDAEAGLAAALNQLLSANRAPSGLFRHYGDGRRRGRFPNFATQIYAVLALSTVSRLGLDDRALPAARAAGDKLLELQLADGGWPWLFDAERGRVVERYEIYCVHQHAMAPMGLLELAGATGDDRYTQAVGYGVGWIAGRNELGADMVDAADGLVYRGIRRRGRWADAALGAGTGLALLGGPEAPRSRRAELDRTDRPYSMGWILEAWAGREDVLGGA